ncbi:hypothetical protein [Mycobacterium sp. 050134]|uniref:hypothetical protein n=1 Tax=Mycobacterium sp. 050134 TaxID=3096111 RepID=UPI002ED8EB69
MVWLAVMLAVEGAALFVVGFVANTYAYGAGIPRIAGVMLDKEAGRDDQLTALGSLCVLAAVVAGVGAVVALLAAVA